jgi:putative phage-type endonuclease
MIAQLTDYGTREAWLASRKEAIGASEVAALFGLMPKAWGSQYTLWANKVGLGPPPEELTGEWLEWGQILEEPIAQRYQTVTHRKLWKGGGPFCVAQHSTLPYLRCTPDRFVVEAPDREGVGVLQVKNASWFKDSDWDEGTPDYVRVQLQTEMCVTGAAWGSAAVLVGGNKFRYVDVEREPELIAEIEAQVQHFWQSYVVTGAAPDIDASEATTAFLKRLHPKDNGETVQLDGDALAIVFEWEKAKAALAASAQAMKVHETAKDLALNRLRDLIGDATFGALPDGRLLSLRTTENSGHTTAPYSYRTLKIEKSKPTTPTIKSKGKRK